MVFEQAVFSRRKTVRVDPLRFLNKFIART